MTPERRHWLRNDGMGAPDPWESLSDRLQHAEQHKVDFHSEIGPGRCARVKDMLLLESLKEGHISRFS